MKIRLTLISVLFAISIGTANAGLIYTNDFENSSTDGFSSDSIENTPSGPTFLGRFGSEVVSLALDDLDEHTGLVLTFDLFILNDWQGNAGLDVWGLNADRNNLLTTTFSNDPDRPQSYPDAWWYGNNPAGFESLSTGIAGFETASIYSIRLEFEHTADNLLLDFFAIGLEGSLDERSWGLDNVEVAIIPEPATVALVLAGMMLTTVFPARIRQYVVAS